MSNIEQVESGGEQYLITEDLGEKIESLRHVGLRTPDADSSFISDVQDDIAGNLQNALGSEIDVVRFKMRDIASSVISLIDEKYGDDVFVVSTCPEIAHPSRGTSFEVNRLVNFRGESLGIGPRPGTAFVEAQAQNVRTQSRGADVVIAEDGIFSGSTVEYVTDKLTRAGVNVVGLVTGFRFGSGVDDEGVEDALETHVVQDDLALLDWVPDHDFIPFAPGSGKVLGFDLAGRPYPFYNNNHESYSFPYVKPFAPIEEWAQIPTEKAARFSAKCIGLAIDVFSELEKANDKTITIGDVGRSKQRVGIPLEVRERRDGEDFRLLPASNQRVVTFLSESL